MINRLAAIALLLAFNFGITTTVFLFSYLLKSALNIDLFPSGHLSDVVIPRD